MGQQSVKQRAGTTAMRKGSGGVTSANSKGMSLSGSANNAQGNKGPAFPKNQKSRPIVTGTPGPRHSKFGTVTKKVTPSKG